MTGSEKINAFIEAEGKGNVRDALNVALTRIELLQIEKAGLIEMLDRAAIAAAEAHQSQPFQVIANLTRKLGDTIKALRFARSVMIENGVTETSERLAIEKIDEALKPYEPSQKPTYGPGPMIQERPRPEETDLEDENQPVTA